MAKPTTQVQPKPKPLTITAWALVRLKGGLAPLRFELDVERDLSGVDCRRVELGEPDYRAIAESKVKHFISSHTPEWRDGE